jgi:hypothetical protein
MPTKVTTETASSSKTNGGLVWESAAHATAAIGKLHFKDFIKLLTAVVL